MHISKHQVKWMVLAVAVALVYSSIASVSAAFVPAGKSRVISSADASAVGAGIHKIKHVIVIMQENRSFDTYFGTYPGADGIPMDANGVPTVCNVEPISGDCIKPFMTHANANFGGPHGSGDAKTSIDGGKMDGFIAAFNSASGSTCVNVDDPNCVLDTALSTNVMGYHTQSDIPNYWTYAQDFVLQDHMFEPETSWSLPSHLFMVSGWSASCAKHNVPSSCTNNIDQAPAQTASNIYAWTDMTYLMHKNGISWGYYVTPGGTPDCSDPSAPNCTPMPQSAATPSIWNPLPYFDTVRGDGQGGDIKSVASFYSAAKAGTLPAVSWVVPSQVVSEHPPATVSAGQSYVTSLINAVMKSPDWSSSAIFLAWDDWGGFYDNVVPPVVDKNGYGLRVPGLVISPYAKTGYIDHQTLSFDAYNKFIEDDFLGGQRLDPKLDGRPDPRPDVRENEAVLGDLVNDFNFSQAPRSPVLLPEIPATTLTTSKPSPIAGEVAVTGNDQATVSWQAPFNTSNLPITSYQVTPYLAGVAQPVQSFAPDGGKVVLTGLANGGSYTFQVAAVNSVGVGPWSSSTQLVVIGAPTVPTAVVATAGHNSAVVSWKTPAITNGSAITEYIIVPYYGTSHLAARFFGPKSTPRTITGLTAGTSYVFKVFAINARGGSVAGVSNAVKPTSS